MYQQFGITSERALASWSRDDVHNLTVAEERSVCSLHWLTGDIASSLKLQTEGAKLKTFFLFIPKQDKIKHTNSKEHSEIKGAHIVLFFC